MNKYATPIKYGLIGGILMVVLLMLIYLVAPAKLASMITMVVYVPVLFCMIWGGITYRKEVGAFGSFGEAFLAVFIISVISTLIFDTFGYLLYAVIDPDLPAYIKDLSLQNTAEMVEKFGGSDEEVEKALKRIEDTDFTPTLKSTLIRYASSFAIGAILSALIALFVRRGDRQPEITDAA